MAEGSGLRFNIRDSTIRRGLQIQCSTLRRGLHSSSSLGFPYRILNINHKKELLWSLWVRSIVLVKAPDTRYDIGLRGLWFHDRVKNTKAL